MKSYFEKDRARKVKIENFGGQKLFDNAIMRKFLIQRVKFFKSFLMVSLLYLSLKEIDWPKLVEQKSRAVIKKFMRHGKAAFKVIW